jgi:ankyrin repeat protein
MRFLIVLAFMAQTLSAQSLPDVRAAVTRALPILQRSAGEFVAKRACVSCHHNILTILSLDLARSRGFEIDASVLRAVEDKTFRELRNATALDNAIQATTLNDPTPNDSYLLMAAHDAGIAPDLVTAVYARRLVRWQRDGHWITSDFRPPHSSSFFMATATAIRAIRFYMPEELRGERDASIRSARQWLFENTPVSTEDGAFRLMGLVWSDASRQEISAAARDLRAMQKSNGGWPQISHSDPDAYSTGEALFALREAGVSTTDAVWTKGLMFLLSTQAKDGTWRTRSRMISPAEVSPPYFPTGFPYGKDEFLSYAGSCWAVMALLSALPESPNRIGPQESTSSTTADPPSWLRVALFGTAQQLATLLDSGLDPNSRTNKNGTTVLMAAAPDAEKVRLLLERGADAKARVATGAAANDALTIASVYRGTAPSLRVLLAAGAEAQPPESVRVRNSPLVLASMTGDFENIKLLLENGARPEEKALAEAVTFGYPDVVRALIQGGANAGIVENSGINLLHWATIANRPQLIAPLVEAGVPINATDDNGFTALMYAATIDFGNTDVLNALVRAGADKKIQNREGRTPLAQARHFRLSHLEPALR